jgi:hypothetical protein
MSNDVEKPADVFEVHITLKNGVTITADVTSWAWKTNGMREVIGAKWTSPADEDGKKYRQLGWFDWDHVAAVVLV